jgi:hypothetical protein
VYKSYGRSCRNNQIDYAKITEKIPKSSQGITQPIAILVMPNEITTEDKNNCTNDCVNNNKTDYVLKLFIHKWALLNYYR